jgi:hypothetical protein
VPPGAYDLDINSSVFNCIDPSHVTMEWDCFPENAQSDEEKCANFANGAKGLSSVTFTIAAGESFTLSVMLIPPAGSVALPSRGEYTLTSAT